MNIKEIIVTILLLLLVIPSNVYATSTTAQSSASQAWNDPASWDNGIPGCFDIIVIPAGIYIEVSTMVDLTGCPSTLLIVEGQLHFQTGKKLKMFDGSSIEIPTGGMITSGGGVGNSSYIEIGDDIAWAASDGDLMGPVLLCPSCPLSIDIDYYTLIKNELDIQLKWGTISELDNSHFILERKSDEGNWDFLAKIDGSGTTSISCHYEYFDTEKTVGNIYYKLSQFDYNGDSEVIGIKSVNIGTDLTIQAVYNLQGQPVRINDSELKIVRYTNGQTQIMYR